MKSGSGWRRLDSETVAIDESSSMISRRLSLGKSKLDIVGCLMIFYCELEMNRKGFVFWYTTCLMNCPNEFELEGNVILEFQFSAGLVSTFYWFFY